MAEAQKTAKELLLEQIARMPEAQRTYLEQRIRHDDRLPDETLRQLAGDIKVVMDAVDALAKAERLLADKVLPDGDCTRAKRLFNTAVGCGNDLTPESAEWLDRHLGVCETCLDKFGELWVKHMEG